MQRKYLTLVYGTFLVKDSKYNEFSRNVFSHCSPYDYTLMNDVIDVMIKRYGTNKLKIVEK